MKRVLWYIGIILLIVVGVWYGYRRFFLKEKKVTVSSILERTFKVERGDIIKTISAFGQTVANREASLTFRTGGILNKIYVKKGDKVKKGKILAVLNNAQQKANLFQAENDYKKAKVDGAASEIEEKSLNYEASYENYQKTLIQAPFNGEVVDVSAYEGDTVSSSTPIVSLINRDKIFVEADVDEVDIKEVSVGQKAEVSFDAYPDLILPAKVSDISPVAITKGGITIIEVKLELFEFDERIKSGFSAEAEIVVVETHNVLRVPLESVVERKGKYFVSLVSKNGNKTTPVKVGISNGEYIQITSGLKEGDKIVANGYKLSEKLEKLEEGRKGEEKGKEAMKIIEGKNPKRKFRPPKPIFK